MSGFGSFLNNFYHGLISKVIDEKAIEEYKTNKNFDDSLVDIKYDEEIIVRENTNLNRMVNRRVTLVETPQVVEVETIYTEEDERVYEPEPELEKEPEMRVERIVEEEHIPPTKRFAQKIREAKLARMSKLLHTEYIPFISNIQSPERHSQSQPPMHQMQPNQNSHQVHYSQQMHNNTQNQKSTNTHNQSQYLDHSQFNNANNSSIQNQPHNNTQQSPILRHIIGNSNNIQNTQINQVNQKNISLNNTIYKEESNSPSRRKLYSNSINVTPGRKDTFTNIVEMSNVNYNNFSVVSEVNNNTFLIDNSINHKDLSMDDKEFILKMEMKAKKEKENMKTSQLGRKKQLSKYSPVVLGDQFTEEEKLKMGMTSEYNLNNSRPPQNEQEKKKITNIFMKNKSIEDGSQIIKWRSKSKNCAEEVEVKNYERILSVTMQKQFEKTRINIPNPDRLENYRDERFMRDKPQIAKEADNLQRMIKHEKRNDKTKIASSIIDDIEKQESWQSYTTLLFADSQMNKDLNINGGNNKTSQTTKGK